MTRYLIKLISRVSLISTIIVLLALALGHFLPEEEIIFAGQKRPLNDTLEIYRMSPFHRLNIPLTKNNNTDFQPVWSRDGQQIAFVSDGFGVGFTIYTMDSQGKNLQQVIPDPRNDNAPTWSPDNQAIAFVSTGYETLSELLVIDLKSKLIQPLTFDPRSEESPNWSPDGKEIAFVSYMEGENSNRDIYSINVQTGAIRHLLTTDDSESHPVWSPDSRYLLYIKGDYPATLQIFDTFTNKSSLLYQGNISSASFNNTDWSPDGSKVLASFYNGVYKIPVADCLEQSTLCKAELIPIWMGFYPNVRWRPRQP